MAKRTALDISKAVGKQLLGLAIVLAVVVGVIAGGLAVRSIVKVKTAETVAVTQAVNDGTTHDMTIVWPTGKEQTYTYSETITPRKSSYTGPINEHRTEIFMLSLNPLDSANKAGERVTPSTFAEGDRPSIQLNENGVNTSKAAGAEAAGQGGSNPVLGEYFGWIGFILFGVIGLFVITGVWKWLWPKIEPAVAAAVGGVATGGEAVIAKLIDALHQSTPVPAVVPPPAAAPAALRVVSAAPTPEPNAQTAQPKAEAAATGTGQPVADTTAGTGLHSGTLGNA